MHSSYLRLLPAGLAETTRPPNARAPGAESGERLGLRHDMQASLTATVRT